LPISTIRASVRLTQRLVCFGAFCARPPAAEPTQQEEQRVPPESLGFVVVVLDFQHFFPMPAGVLT
jgi:hypothetical protein